MSRPVTRGSARRLIQGALIVLGVALAFLVAAGLAAAIAGEETRWLWPFVVTASLIGAAALGFVGRNLRRHFDSLDGVRGLIVALSGRGLDAIPGPIGATTNDESGRLRAAIYDLVVRWRGETMAPDDRLEAVLGAIGEGVVTVTDQGQVSLVNGPAMACLGAERVAVGTSVYAALEREPLTAAMNRAQATGKPIAARLATVEGDELAVTVIDLHDHGGAVICIVVPEPAERRVLAHDLSLHDVPPEADGFRDDTPLRDLPMVSLDVETTGLDVGRDRVVSIGTVRMHGARIYRSSMMDVLINPGVPIPRRSTAIHGITDAMVADAAAFSETAPTLARMLEGVVVIGHNIGFDIAMLRRESALAGLAWSDPATLDTLLLAAALDKGESDLNLEAVAERFAVDIHGRHTALGDSLVTAEILARMVARLSDRGIATLGEAQAFARSAKRLVKHQAAAGW